MTAAQGPGATAGDGTVALVTGASSGIGEATVRKLARRGVRVAALARREEKLAALAAGLAAEGQHVLALPVDITDEKKGRAAVSRVVEEFGRLDVMVNNAGIMLIGPFDGSKTGDWQQMLELNLSALLHLTQEAIPHLRAAAAGLRGVSDLINVGSVAGRVARGGYSVYNATKFGVTAFSEALRQELAPDGVRVCCVEPGAVATELLSHVDDNVRESMLSAPAYRSIKPVGAGEVADIIDFIVHLPPSAAINEIVIRPARQAL